MRLVFSYEKGRGGIYAALTCSSGVEGHYSLQEAKTASPLRPNFVIARSTLRVRRGNLRNLWNQNAEFRETDWLGAVCVRRSEDREI